ncbi:MAG: efflux RND transporter periplasmic adaptor subunit [Myxococcota bacterium]
MSHRFLSVLVAIGLAAGSVACGKQSAPEARGPEVVVAPVEKRDVEIYSEWVGTTTGAVNAEIYPKIQGYLLKQAYADGVQVKAGQLLFQIDPRQFQAAQDVAQGQLQRAQAALGKAEQDVTRYTPLAAQGAVSQQELDDAIQARLGARAQLVSARASLDDAKLNLAWTEVKSPVDGVAAIASAQVGNLVGPTTLLTSVSQLDPIKVSFPVSEVEYLRFADVIAAQVKSGEVTQKTGLALILADGKRYPETGRFDSVNLAVSQTTGTITLQAAFPNPNNILRPGQFAKVRAVTQQLPGALVIPQRAVRDLQGISQVAVVGSEEKVTFKNIKLGPATGSDYVVAEGLSAGERIVVEGLQKIRDGIAVTASAALAPVGAPATPAAEKPAAEPGT